jgi:hypothetical protein
MPMKRSPSNQQLADVEKRPVGTIALKSRFFPAMALLWGVGSIGISVALNFYFGHDIGGIAWPYISDTAKDMPQAGLFAYGMTVTSVMMSAVVVIQYGKVKRDLLRLHGHELGDWLSRSSKGRKRNKASLVTGLIAAPNLGLLATFDTARAPGLHLLFVLIFFPCMIIYLFATTSLYAHLVHASGSQTASDASVGRRKKDDDDQGGALVGGGFSSREQASLCSSLLWKRIVCTIFIVAVILYLPVGMCLVTDWYNYANDAYVHAFRAVCQHIAVLSLITFFGTYLIDFRDLNFFIVQGS